MKKKILILSFLTATILLALTGCVPGDATYTTVNPAGFFWGIWHGWLAPVSLIIGFFNRNIRIYEIANVGWWYDLGFYIAIISGFGGLSLFRRKKQNKE